MLLINCTVNALAFQVPNARIVQQRHCAVALAGRGLQFRQSVGPLYLGVEKDDDESDGDSSVDVESSEDDSKTSEDTNPSSSGQTNIFEQIFDPIISNPLFPTFLFWLPFVANDKLRKRFSYFVSTNLDLRIAVPVSGACLVGAVLYLVYQDRVYGIELAMSRTAEALKQLRGARTAQISYGGGSSDDDEYKMALENYEHFLREELELRLVVPGLKVPNVPGAPAEREEDRAAVRQFLGMEITEAGDLERI